MRRGPKVTSIRAKILMLVSLPVIAGIAGVAAFLLVARAQANAEDSVRRTLAIRAATQEASQALDALESAQTALYLGDQFGLAGADPGVAEAAFMRAVEDLSDLVISDPDLVRLIDRLGDEVAARERLTAEFGERFSEGDFDFSEFFDDPSLMIAFAAPERTLAEIDSHSEIELASTTSSAMAARRRLQIAVPASVGLALLVSLALALAAGRRLGMRVEEVAGNATRLANEEPLQPVSPGDDEVARLADKLDEAARLLASRQDDLRRAMDSTDRANRAKSEFLSRMSHELRTPLNSILGFGQLLAMNPSLGEDDADSVTKILSAGKHLLGLIDEVLDVARIEAGAMSLSLEPVAIGEAVRSALDLVAPMAMARDLRINHDAAAFEGRAVVADVRRLNQVLLNLLSNAIKYNVEGGSVSITAEEGDGTLSIRIADTGSGISAEHLEHLYTPFDRLGAQRTDVEGTGLGLALSKRLVEAMEGSIEVESTPGAGSTFSVTLPSAQAIEEDAAEPRAPVAGAAHTVLYIEDNLANLKLVERLVARRGGIRLVSAMQGRLGVELAKQHAPDLILLDLHLPDLPGEEVLERLRGDGRTAGVPVIAISADATTHRRRTLAAMGVHAYLTKPFDIDRFLSLLDELLSGRSAEVAG